MDAIPASVVYPLLGNAPDIMSRVQGAVYILNGRKVILPAKIADETVRKLVLDSHKNIFNQRKNGSANLKSYYQVLLEKKQKDTCKDGKVDCGEELLGLETLGFLDELLETMLGSVHLDDDTYKLNTEDFEAHVKILSGVESQWTIRIKNCVLIPQSLGGPRYPYEETRVVKISTNHAKWRDRKVRRITSVQVYAELKLP